LAAVDQVRVERVGGDVAVLLDANGVPVAEGDLAVAAAAGDAGRAALLLAAVDPVRELVVGDDVIELGGWLVVPAAPRLAAVDADRGALVGGQQDDLRVVGVDPDGVIVVAAGGALDEGERLAAVGRAVEGDVGDVDDVGVFGIDLDLGEVAAAAPQARVGVDTPPALAGVVGAVQ